MSLPPPVVGLRLFVWICRPQTVTLACLACYDLPFWCKMQVGSCWPLFGCLGQLGIFEVAPGHGYAWPTTRGRQGGGAGRDPEQPPGNPGRGIPDQEPGLSHAPPSAPPPRLPPRSGSWRGSCSARPSRRGGRRASRPGVHRALDPKANPPLHLSFKIIQKQTPRGLSESPQGGLLWDRYFFSMVGILSKSRL